MLPMNRKKTNTDGGAALADRTIHCNNNTSTYTRFACKLLGRALPNSSDGTDAKIRIKVRLVYEIKFKKKKKPLKIVYCERVWSAVIRNRF